MCEFDLKNLTQVSGPLFLHFYLKSHLDDLMFLLILNSVS